MGKDLEKSIENQCKGKKYQHDKKKAKGIGCKSDKNKLLSFAMDEIKGVFKDLSFETLLNKFLQRGTQNANESYHHLVWDRCPYQSQYLQVGIS